VTLAKRVNAGYGQGLALLRELESHGQIRRAGARRTSLWRLVSEEELIADDSASRLLADPRPPMRNARSSSRPG
jgi:hypothetical protein